MNNTPTVVIAPNPIVDTGLRFDHRPEVKLGLFVKIARWYCLRTDSDEARNSRREGEIHAYTGLNGSGKTECAVDDTIPALDGIEWECYEEDHKHNDPIWDDNGEFVEYGPAAQHKGFVRVLSTVRLYDDKTGKLHHRYEKLYDWHQLEDLEHAEIIMDEIVGVAHSRDSGSLPHNIMNLLMQLRKGECIVRWTAPHWARADKLLREVTKVITVCVGDLPDRSRGGLWSANRRFLRRTYSTEDFDEWTAGRRDKLEPIVTEHHWGPAGRAFNMYRTKQKVTRLGHASETGVCVACGGTRTRVQCSCEDYVEKKRAGRPSRLKDLAAAAVDKSSVDELTSVAPAHRH